MPRWEFFKNFSIKWKGAWWDDAPPKFYPSHPIVSKFLERPASLKCLPCPSPQSSCTLSFRQPLTNQILLPGPIALLPHHILKVYRFSSSLRELKWTNGKTRIVAPPTSITRKVNFFNTAFLNLVVCLLVYFHE